MEGAGTGKVDNQQILHNVSFFYSGWDRRPWTVLSRSDTTALCFNRITDSLGRVNWEGGRARELP